MWIVYFDDTHAAAMISATVGIITADSPRTITSLPASADCA